MEKKNNAITSIYEQGSVLEKNDMNYDKNQMILMILILSVILKKGIEDNKRWDDFSKSIKTESHFFPKGELLERIEQIAIYATDTIKKGTIIYRAREYGQDDFSKNEEIVSLSGMIEERYPNLDSMNDVELANIIQEMILSFYGEKKLEIEKKVEEITKAMEPFWGFDKRESDAPPSEKAIEGRKRPKRARTTRMENLIMRMLSRII